MIKGKWQGIVFIFLILLLAIGLSTVALNERSEQESEKVHKMSIALVNEDVGTDFNASDVNFGDEFSNQMNKDQSHDWYIVSRGVAESGFERNIYDMIIVIPNNFSENALSIDEDAPEQVTLEYRINTTGHEDVRADAEKAAGEVLTNFNKELIDVFFVSIIGNLQEAQDHIGDIIAKEKEYTDEYTVNVFNPLDNFTNQFERIQQYADMSKSNYNQLDDVLNNFETNLLDKAETSAAYDEDIANALLQKEESSVATSTFAEQFDQLLGQMNEEDALGQLAQLEAVNTYLFDQLRERDSNDERDRERSLQERIVILNNHFNQLKADTDLFSEIDLEELVNDLPNNIKTIVAKSFDDDTMENIKVNDLIKDLDENILKNISNSIGMLPEDEEAINDLVLPIGTKVKLKNVALISNKFKKIDEFYQAPDEEKEKPNYKLLEKPFSEVKQSLIDEGIEVSDTITIEEYKSNSFDFTLQGPVGFDVEGIFINEKEVSEGHILLGEEEGGENLAVEIVATFKLSKEYEDLDFFQPVDWNWTLKQKNEKSETITPEAPDEDNSPEPPPENEESGEGREEDSGEDETVGTEEQTEDASEDEEDPEAPEEPEQPDQPEEPEEPEEPTVIKESVHQYYWKQSVQSALYDQERFTRNLIEEAVGLYEAVDSLDTLYNLYFGFDLSDERQPLAEQDIRDQAMKDSLYYLVHKKELKEIIQDRISNDVAKTVTDEINKPLSVFQTDVEEYQSYLENVQADSSKLAETLEEASAQAGNLNTNVGQVLEDVDVWRNNSNDLVVEQLDVLNKDSDMQTALLNLDSGFKPILSTSESLAEQAKSNFDSTEQVYETLDSIDEQADTIEQSGTTLVSQANELASKFTEKAAEDMDFADNFNEVLANSRIGDRQNEDLYQFLSNPVESENTGIIKETQSFTPYFIVFIMAIVSFFTAYVLSNHKNASTPAKEFEADQTFIQKNMGPMMMTGGIGLIEGILIGITTFILLDIPQTGAFTWIAFITVMMLGMVLLATYALRQLQMIGMFLLLVVFSLYLLLTKSLGFQFGGNEAIGIARKVSPLQQLESWLHAFMEGTMSTTTLTIAFIILIVAVMIGLALNMLIIGNNSKEVGVDDERTKEAN